MTNFVDGAFQKSAATAETLPIRAPADGRTLAHVALSTKAQVDAAVETAKKAFPAWSRDAQTPRTRAKILYRFRELCLESADLLVAAIAAENGKNEAEALGDLMKGLETVEWACSMPNNAAYAGRTLRVSGGGLSCADVAEPLGVVACVAPFNFPFMVPMWTLPIALVAGNCVVLKPSEKCPITTQIAAEIMQRAGLPRGVLTVVHGDGTAVRALCDHADVHALTFVGSSRVAELVAKRCRAQVHKRVLALGGAKNHLIALCDGPLDVEGASRDVVASFAGCAGQRCMAASVLVCVGTEAECAPLLKRIVERARALEAGQRKGQVGAIINKESVERMKRYVDEAKHCEILLDGRGWTTKSNEGGATKSAAGGNWFGPTVIKFDAWREDAPALHDEIFGPVLSVVRVDSEAEALRIENTSPYGNAASVYTEDGGRAQWFADRFRAGMIGVNIGVPVPREPFSFGGMFGTRSKFGDFDVTGDGAMRFFTRRRKITTRWRGGGRRIVDRASFVGKM